MLSHFVYNINASGEFFRRCNIFMKNKNLVVVMIVMLVNTLSYGIIIPLLYPYAQRFGINAVGMSLLFATYSLAQFIATPIIGRLSDKYGRKPLLLLSLFGTSVSLALFASATSVFMLFFARFLDGITGGNTSVAQAIIADSTKEKDRAKAFGLLGAAFGFGFTFGPAIGGVLSNYSLTAPFWFASIIALLGTVLGVIILKETNKNRQDNIDMKGLFNFKGLKSAIIEPITGPVLLVSFITLIGVNAMIIGFQTNSVDVLKLSTTQIAMLFTVYGIMNIIMQGFGIRLILNKAKSHLSVLKASILFSIFAILLVAIPVGYWYFFLTMMVFGVVSSPQGPVIVGMISNRTRAEDQGGIMGINQSYTSIAQIVGPLAAGVVVGLSPSYVFVMVAIFFAISLIPASKIKPSNKKLDL
ncbi:MFS transporter [Patescibacteria group bacterium]